MVVRRDHRDVVGCLDKFKFTPSIDLMRALKMLSALIGLR